jgi:uncharacterized protein (TIRG00374 family)
VKRAIQIVAGLAVSGGAVWLTLRGKDLGAIWSAVLSADYRYLFPYFLVLVAIHLIRTVRWGILLEPIAKVSFARLNAASAVGFMALALLPFRLGELARPYLIAERPHLRVSAALSSVAVERVADGIFMAVVLMLALLGVPDGTPGLPFLRASGLLVFAFFAVLLAFLVIAYRNPIRAVRLTHRLIDPISARAAERLSGMVNAFVEGLRRVPSRGKVALFFALTVVYWSVNAWGMALLARGFGFDLSAIAACTLLGALVVGITIPAGPGSLGTFQAAIVLALALFAPRDVVDTRGNAYSYVLWAVQMGQMLLFGVVFLFSRHIRLGRVFRAPDESET